MQAYEARLVRAQDDIQQCKQRAQNRGKQVRHGRIGIDQGQIEQHDPTVVVGLYGQIQKDPPDDDLKHASEDFQSNVVRQTGNENVHGCDGDDNAGRPEAGLDQHVLVVRPDALPRKARRVVGRIDRKVEVRAILQLGAGLFRIFPGHFGCGGRYQRVDALVVHDVGRVNVVQYCYAADHDEPNG